MANKTMPCPHCWGEQGFLFDNKGKKEWIVCKNCNGKGFIFGNKAKGVIESNKNLVPEKEPPKCFRCGCPKPDDGNFLCDSCRTSVVDSVLVCQPKRYANLAEKELARNAREAKK